MGINADALRRTQRLGGRGGTAKGKKDKQEPPAGAFAISTAPDAQSALEREQEVVLAAEMAQEDTAAACGLPEAAVSVAEIGAE